MGSRFSRFPLLAAGQGESQQPADPPAHVHESTTLTPRITEGWGKQGPAVAGLFLNATPGSLAAMFLLHGHGLSLAHSWRYAFGVGGSLGAAVLVLRLYVPESPRWLMLRGYEEQANKVAREIEDRVSRGNPESLPKPHATTICHGTCCLSPWQFSGPMLLGPLFDKIGRKPMITATYGTARLLLLGTIYPFAHGLIGPRGLGTCFTLVFFVASSPSSSVKNTWKWTT
jgi:MFS family permease